MKIEKDMIFKLNCLTKDRDTDFWVMHLYVFQGNKQGYAQLRVYDKRVVDYLRYFNTINSSDLNIDVTWFVQPFEDIDMMLF